MVAELRLKPVCPAASLARTGQETGRSPLRPFPKRFLRPTEFMTTSNDETEPRPAQPRATTRSALIKRLFHLLERQIAQLETNMDDFGDKEVAVLGSLTRNLEKLIELDLQEKSRSGKRTRRSDIDALRKKLADRIEQLKKA